MNSNIIAKLKINIGLGKNNPCLTIHSHDDISALVHQLVTKYSLPKRVYEEVMAKIIEEFGGDITQLRDAKLYDQSLKRNSSHKSIPQHKKSNRSPLPQKKINKEKSLESKNKTPRQSRSPFKLKTPIKSSKKHLLTDRSKQKSFDCQIAPQKCKKNNPLQKENSTQNKSNRSHEKFQVKSQRTFKSSRDKLVSPTKVCNYDDNIRSLFQYLISQNTTDEKKLFPQNICLTGLNRNFLGQLQLFFQLLEQNVFQNLTEQVFVRKAHQLGYHKKLGSIYVN